ncbi:MAG: phospholipase D family protein [Cyclobacteriaceae bacterium]
MLAAVRNATLHMGTSAMRQVMEAIHSATREVCVLSPYLNGEQLELLMQLHEKGIKLMLVTTVCQGSIGNVEGYDFRKELIRQVKRHDPEAREKKESLQGLLSFLWFALLTFAGVGIWTYFYYHLYAQLVMLLLFVLTAIFIYATIGEIRRTKEYHYSYRTLFPIKVFIAPDNRQIRNSSKYFLHAKAFIIDDETAYLGSADFTSSGLSSNYESIIKLTDREAISELKAELQRLYRTSSEDMDFVNIEEWGRMIYEEPRR